MSDTIRIVIAEDSPTVRQHLLNIIAVAPDLRVVGEARNGREAVQMVEQLRPDVVSMDINMPEMDGLEATREIMARAPTPVVVVSGMLEMDIDLSLRALQHGALAVVNKPPDRNNPDFDRRQRELITTLRAMAAVKVISRRRQRLPEVSETQQLPRLIGSRRTRNRPEVLVIGASTGGPSAIYRLLKQLPSDFPLPVVIVQHMPTEFIAGLVRWLGGATALDVQVAYAGCVLQPGMVVVAPGDQHLIVSRKNNDLFLSFMPSDKIHRYCPSVDVLFESVAKTCGEASIGVILSGMGDDGAAGLLAMRQAGAYTLAQDESTATVFGMPAAAMARGAVEHVEALTNLAPQILKLL